MSNTVTKSVSSSVKVKGFCGQCEKGVINDLLWTEYHFIEEKLVIEHKLRCPECDEEVWVEVK